ncbi:MAG: hypothetical protein MUC88_26560, partial [Planctomycetes bacterium]|nr:hypothetical protein [Planctomycetota bacterium]
SVASVGFYAVEPNRTADGLVGIHARRHPGGGVRLATQPQSSARPLFLALPSTPEPSQNPALVPLYECRQKDADRYVYSTQPQPEETGWERAERPLCRVWKVPPGLLLWDGQARPARAR